MPDALARLQVDRHEALAKQIVAGPMAAEIVAGGHLDRQVRDAELLVNLKLTPQASMSGVRPRVLQPRVVAELTGLRNRVEDPLPLPRLHVERANEALRVRPAPRRPASPVRGADEDDVLGDHWRTVPGDIAGDRIELLVVILFQIDDTLVAKPGQRSEERRVG